MNRISSTIISAVTAITMIGGLAFRQLFQPQMRKPAELLRKQEPLKVNQSLLKQATPDNTHIVVSIPKQRAYLMIGDQIVAEGPVSSGKRGHTSPTGHMH